MNKAQLEANRIIDGFGGTSATARFCDLTTGAISQWRTSENGIPKAWRRVFKQSRPDLFADKSQKKA